MKLKYGAKYIFFLGSIACISLLFTNFGFKDSNNKTIEDKTSRIIIESPKKANILESRDIVNEEGTPVSVPVTNGKLISEIQPLPVLDLNDIIVITPLQ